MIFGWGTDSVPWQPNDNTTRTQVPTSPAYSLMLLLPRASIKGPFGSALEGQFHYSLNQSVIRIVQTLEKSNTAIS